MFKKSIIALLLIVGSIGFVSTPTVVYAQENETEPPAVLLGDGSCPQGMSVATCMRLTAELTNDQVGLSDSDVPLSLSIVRIVRVALSVLGVVFLVLTVYAGFTWMTAAGNDDRVARAKKIITSSVIARSAGRDFSFLFRLLACNGGILRLVSFFSH